MKTSVTTVTFRQKNIVEVGALAHKAGLEAIEWGGDVHVPPGKAEAAWLAQKVTKASGLMVSAYGSYYRCGETECFSPVLETAMLLEAPVIRVWAGERGSRLYSEAQQEAVAERLCEAVGEAARQGVTVATEYHANTLTDTLASTLWLLERVPGLRTLWQPPVGLGEKENLYALQSLGGRVANLHVYQWGAGGERQPLEAGAAVWRRYFAAAKAAGTPGYATLEFVKDDSEERFLQDAATLKRLLKGE